MRTNKHKKERTHPNITALDATDLLYKCVGVSSFSVWQISDRVVEIQ